MMLTAVFIFNIATSISIVLLINHLKCVKEAGSVTQNYTFAFDSRGITLFIADTGNSAHRYTLATPFDISTASYDTLVTGKLMPHDVEIH